MELTDIHLGILIVTAVGILYADYLGHQYMRGHVAVLPKRTIQMLHRAVWVGLLGMIATGVWIAVPLWEYVRAEPAFFIKMAFVAILAWNAWFIGRVAHVAYEQPFASLDRDTRNLLVVSGGVSLAGWVGSAIIGFFFL